MLKKRKNRGFLLLEVLISIIIIATTLIVINRGFSVALKAVKLARDYLLVNCVLEDKLFDVQIKSSFADTKISDAAFLGQQEFLYSIEVSAPDIKDEKDDSLEELPIKQVKLNINWKDGKDTAGLGVLTYVFEKKE